MSGRRKARHLLAAEDNPTTINKLLKRLGQLGTPMPSSPIPQLPGLPSTSGRPMRTIVPCKDGKKRHLKNSPGTPLYTQRRRKINEPLALAMVIRGWVGERSMDLDIVVSLIYNECKTEACLFKMWLTGHCYRYAQKQYGVEYGP